MIDISIERMNRERQLADSEIPAEDMSIAVHEVGHAMVAREAGLTPTKLVISQFWSPDGYCEIREDHVVGDDEARGLLQTYLAGIEAQHLWTAQMALPAVVGTDVYDQKAYADFCQAHDFHYPQEEARAAAVAILSVPAAWTELQDIAMDLARHGRLSW